LDLNHVAPVYDIKTHNGQEIKAPNLVVGEPYPVTNDFDIMHMSLPKELVAAFKLSSGKINPMAIYNAFRVDGLSSLISDSRRLLKYLSSSEPFLSNPEYQQIRNLTTFLNQQEPGDENGKTRFEKYIAELKPDMGSISVGELLYFCAANAIMGKVMFRHGAECRNPAQGQLSPEPFGAVTHFTKSGIVHTDDERTAIKLYLSEKDVLCTQYREVNPYWLTKPRTKAENDIAEQWLTILKIQALSGMHWDIVTSFENIIGIENKYRASLAPPPVKNTGPYAEKYKEIRSFLDESILMTETERTAMRAELLKTAYEDNEIPKFKEELKQMFIVAKPTSQATSPKRNNRGNKI